MTGWGVTDKVNLKGGFGSNEKITRIVLKLKAIFYGVKTYCKNCVFKSMHDEKTAMCYIHHMRVKNVKIVIHWQTWEWCIERNLWISAAPISGCNNAEADLYPRELEDATEWQLNLVVFKNIIKTFGTPNLDLFVSRINKQLPIFVSWHPKLEGSAIDAFSLVWKQVCFCMFPSFSLVRKSVHGENHSHNYHTKLAIQTLVPSNIIPNHNGIEDQITGIKPLSDPQTIGNTSSDQSIRAIGYQVNIETTVRTSNA